jgi:TPR repeat protein
MAPSKSKRRRAAAPQPSDDPWNRQTAEALTRAYEESEAEWRESRSARRPPHDRGRASATAGAPGGSMGGAWLESRLADIAERLQRSIAGIDPDKSVGALGIRMEELERRLAVAFEDVARRLEGHNLEKVEAQISGLNTHLEQTRGQLERIDAIDHRLRELAERFDELRRQPEAARLSDQAIEALIQSAADRAADRVVQSLPPATPGIDPQRLDALEALMREQIAERRQTEEMTNSVLRTIEDTLGSILDRVDRLDPGLASMLPATRGAGEGYQGTSPLDPLLEAYAQGARALGQLTPAALLDAADYTTSGQRTGPARPDRTVGPNWEEDVVADPRAGERRAQSAALRPQASDISTDEEPARPSASPRAKAEPPTRSGRLSGLLLMLAVTGLFGAGYLAGDYFLAQSNIMVTQDQGSHQTAPETTSSIARALPAVASERDLVAAVQDSLVAYDGAKPSDTPGALPEGLSTTSLGQAAASGNAAAQFEVASRFADGRGLAQSHAQAFAWYQRAAMRGFAPAQFRLATLLERGAGTDVDVERAKVWYRRAAEQGHVNAMHNLAVLTARRDGEGPDYATAATWFREAAERGLTHSQYNLALLCELGLGTQKSLPEAYKWLALAARGGDKEAAVRQQQIKPRLAPAEREAAEQQVAGWRPRTAPLDPARNGEALQVGG